MKIVFSFLSVLLTYLVVNTDGHKPDPAPQSVDYSKSFLGRQLVEDQSVVDLQVLSADEQTVLSEIQHLESIRVKFNVQDPSMLNASSTDWIGVYCPEESTNKEYIDWKYVSGDLQGSVEFGPMVNMRCKYQFRYIQGNVAYGKTTSMSMVGGDEENVQVHISRTSNVDEMRVMWVTGSDDITPSVRYGSDPEALESVATGTSTTYKASDMCEKPATEVGPKKYRHPGFMHDVLLTGLVPGTTYYYRVTGSVESKLYDFHVHESIESGETSMSFFVFGDSGVTNGQKTYKLVERDHKNDPKKYAGLIHIGDLSYAVSSGYKWDIFSSLIEPVGAHLPYMVGIGNHEYCHTSGGDKDPSGADGDGGFRPPGSNYYSDSAGECGVPTYKRFHMPDTGNSLFWYSFDAGLTHHVVISSEHDFFEGSPMYKWLENDLASVDREKTPWVFLYTHRPMYCSEQYYSDYMMSLLLRKGIETLTYKYGVDVVFSGHYHSWERTCAVYKGHCREHKGTPQAPVHIMVGSAGYSLDTQPSYNLPWSLNGQLVWGYSRVHVHNATHTHIEFLKNEEDRVTDETWIVSTHDWNQNVIVGHTAASKAFPSSFLSLSQRGEVELSTTSEAATLIIAEYGQSTEFCGDKQYLISTNDNPDKYWYVEEADESKTEYSIKAALDTPGKEGRWFMDTAEDGRVRFSTAALPEAFLYVDEATGKVSAAVDGALDDGQWWNLTDVELP